MSVGSILSGVNSRHLHAGKGAGMRVWEPIELERDRSYSWQVGPLRFWIRNNGTEWLEAHHHSSGKENEPRLAVALLSEKPLHAEWSRLICGDLSNRLRLFPLLPDRPVVVGSSTVLKVLPGCSARFFVMIPLWLSLQVGAEDRTTLMELPSVVLSNTWFGGLTNGELCYSLKTTAHMTLDGVAPPPHVLICPVYLNNTAGTSLDFQKLCIHVEHLKVYSNGKRLWTNEVSITYEGVNLLSSVKYSEAVPAFEDDCRLINGERVPAEKSIFKKSFSFLRYFTMTE
jgi:hypothetical protein